jgi:hypothetical protein
MIVTLIIMATAGTPGPSTDVWDRRYVVPDLMACQALMREHIGAVFHSRPDIISVSGTCLISMGKDL